MEPLVEELKQKIIKALKLEGTLPAEIDAAAPLFNTGLGLDSIDALDLVVMLERDYGIMIESAAVAETAFASVNALARFVLDHRGSCQKAKPS